jgi:hypothetical protein
MRSQSNSVSPLLFVRVSLVEKYFDTIHILWSEQGLALTSIVARERNGKFEFASQEELEALCPGQFDEMLTAG